MLIVLVSICGFLFYPRTIRNAILIDKSGEYAQFYVQGKIKTFKVIDSYPKFTMLDFKYNIFATFSFNVQSPIKERVMSKSGNSFDLEKFGKIKLAAKPYFYKIDKYNHITICKDNDLIIGQNNIQSFKDASGALSVFIISPLDFSTMRVGISTTNFLSYFHDKITLTCMTPAKLYSIQDSFSMNLPEGSSVTIEFINKQMRLTANGTSKLLKNRLYLNGTSVITSLIRGSEEYTPSYSGILEFLPYEKGISIINELSMEDYLSKVVPSEMNGNANVEALKCQAIAARTYAISDMLKNRFDTYGFYVDDSIQSQVYNNEPAVANTTAAVNSTKGTIITYNGSPIDAKYYSTSAGAGAEYKDIWSNADGTSEKLPYLVAQSYLNSKTPLPKTEGDWLAFYENNTLDTLDTSSDYFRWKIVFSYKGLGNSLSKSLRSIYLNSPGYITFLKGNKKVNSFPDLVNLKDIKVLKRGASGNVAEVSFIYDNVTVNVKGDYNIRGAFRCSEDFTGESTPIVRSKGKALKNTNFLLSSFFSVEKGSNIFTVYGGGYGHGVGMSQAGAMTLASQGKSYQDILNFYYKGIKLDKIY